MIVSSGSAPVIIVGGRLQGRSTAWRLARAGKAVN
jgi:glycine/D-amino acid oxidase-like deaminating enzyme